MNDKDMLILAAKAADIELQQWVESLGKFFLEPYQQHWNPLTDDGDAFRLAVTLQLDIQNSLGKTCEVSRWDKGFDDYVYYIEDYSDDPRAATRRAIVRAAVEIGRFRK